MNEGTSGSGPVNEAPVVESAKVVVDNYVGLVKDRERKRHRDGGSSHHHHKMNKDITKIVLLDESDQVSNGEELKGVKATKPHDLVPKGSAFQLEPRVMLPGSVTSGSHALLTCKYYKEKVY